MYMFLSSVKADKSPEDQGYQWRQLSSDRHQIHALGAKAEVQCLQVSDL